MARECDYLIVGSGIAGASAAYHLVHHGKVILLERESQPGYHSTGRSAAVFAESYGPRLMRVMTVAVRVRDPHHHPRPGTAGTRLRAQSQARRHRRPRAQRRRHPVRAPAHYV